MPNQFLQFLLLAITITTIAKLFPLTNTNVVATTIATTTNVALAYPYPILMVKTIITIDTNVVMVAMATTNPFNPPSTINPISLSLTTTTNTT